jgi:ADP-ribosylglycohydrolase
LNQQIQNRYIGCIIGGAIGDALGAPTEFMSLVDILEQYGEQGVQSYVEFPDGTGEVTDDTQMLLFTADGLLRSIHRAELNGKWGAYLPICHQSYLRWLNTQNDWHSEKALIGVELNGWLIKQSFLYSRRAPGQTCLTALRSEEMGTMEHAINDSKGCGGIMRIAPVGLLFYENPSKAFKIGSELAAITHGHPSGYLAAGYFASLLAYIQRGLSLEQSIEASLNLLQIYPGHEETTNAIHQALNLYKQGSPTFEKLESLGGGWVAEETLAISLYCVLSYPNDFEKAIVLAINHSGDTDSTGAITGNLLGLILGESAIPETWKIQLNHYEPIKQIALDLFTEIKGTFDHPDEEWLKKYPVV